MPQWLKDLIDNYRTDFNTAPLYGGYSRTLKTKIESKQQVKMAFIENLKNFRDTELDQKVCDQIDVLLKKFE